VYVLVPNAQTGAELTCRFAAVFFFFNQMITRTTAPTTAAPMMMPTSAPVLRPVVGEMAAPLESVTVGAACTATPRADVASVVEPMAALSVSVTS